MIAKKIFWCFNIFGKKEGNVMEKINPISFNGNIKITTYKNGKPRIEKYETSKEVDMLAKCVCYDILPGKAKTTVLTHRNSSILKTLVELITTKPLRSNPQMQQTFTKPRHNKFIYEDVFMTADVQQNAKRNSVSVVLDLN